MKNNCGNRNLRTFTKLRNFLLKPLILDILVIESARLRIEDLGNTSEQESSQSATVSSDVRSNLGPSTQDLNDDDDIIEIDSIPASQPKHILEISAEDSEDDFKANTNIIPPSQRGLNRKTGKCRNKKCKAFVK